MWKMRKIFCAALAVLALCLSSGAAAWGNPPSHAISLDTSGTKNFSMLGCGTVEPHSVTVSNTGSQPTGELTIALSGANPAAFVLSRTSIPSIAAGGSDSFTVVPEARLAAGTYAATVTVSGANVTSQSFDVNFTVSAACSPRSSGCNAAFGLLAVLLVLPLAFRRKI